MKRVAVIHSLGKQSNRPVIADFYDEVEIIQQIDNNHVIVQYNGKHYTAIANPFTGLIYVDDLYDEVDLAFRF